MAYVTVDDLRDEYEGAIPASSDVTLTIKIDKAERLIRSRLHMEIADWITAGRATTKDIADVVSDMVLRTVRNTTGVTAQSAGPFSQTFDAAVASGKLWLTRENRMQLGLRRTRSGSAELVDDALECVIQPPTLPDWS